MGCSSSNQVKTKKEQQIKYNKESNISKPSESEKKNELLENNKIVSEISVKPLDDNAGSFSYKDLPNYDLFEKFIKIEKVNKYIQFYQEREVINDIFNDIKPLIDDLFKRFGITYEIIKEDKTINCKEYNVVINKPEIKNSDYYFPLFFLNFWFYPPDAFHHKIKKFIFCEELTYKKGSLSISREACPEWSQTHSMIYRMKIEDKDKLSYAS